MNNKIIRRQLDETLSKFKAMRDVSTPEKGWLHAIHTALGMNGRQFANLLKVSPPRITALEENEKKGTVTIKTLREAAEALDCIFVYSIIPRSSLEQTVKKRAKKIALKRLMDINQTMLLEKQNLNSREIEKLADDLAEELCRTSPKEIWDEDEARRN